MCFNTLKNIKTISAETKKGNGTNGKIAILPAKKQNRPARNKPASYLAEVQPMGMHFNPKRRPVDQTTFSPHCRMDALHRRFVADFPLCETCRPDCEKAASGAKAVFAHGYHERSPHFFCAGAVQPLWPVLIGPRQGALAASRAKPIAR
jgi:hypothetical protein